MDNPYDRNAVRIDLSRYDLTFHYKFVSRPISGIKKLPDKIFKGKVLNLSKTGAQVCANIPDLKMLSLMMDEKILIGCNFPLKEKMVKTLSRVRWIDSSPSDDKICHVMGLEFIRVPIEDKRVLGNYLIRNQIKTAKFNRTFELLNPDKK